MTSPAPAAAVASSPLIPIVVSLTTISTRMDAITRTLRSLLAQDHPDFRVRLHLSREPFLLDAGVPGALPSALEALARADPRLEIRFTPNLGPYRKILPVLAELGGARALVATADDDTVYPPDWLGGLVAAHRRHRCVVCYRGHRMVRRDHVFADYRSWMHGGILRNPDIYNLPTGKDGVLYDTDFFDPRVLNHVRALAIAPTADDLWLKWHYSAFADVPTYIIHPDWKTQSFSDDSFGVSLYRNFNREGGNDETIRQLEAYARGAGGRSFAGRP